MKVELSAKLAKVPLIGIAETLLRTVKTVPGVRALITRLAETQTALRFQW